MKSKMTTNRVGRLALTLTSVGLVAGLGAVAFAVTGSGPRPPAATGAALATKAAPLSIRIAPKTRSVAPGHATSFEVRIRRRDRRQVRLSLVDELPRGITASFQPSSTRKRKARISITTAGARSGGYRLRLRARSGRRRATAALNLVIKSGSAGSGAGESGTNFTISGDLPGPLKPGLTQPLNLVLSNPGPEAVSITGLQVTVASASPPEPSGSLPCSPQDFSVAQFAGAYGFSLPPSTTASLSELGFPQGQWPRVTMVNRPVNQDGCKGGSLSLSYSGTSTGGTP